MNIKTFIHTKIMPLALVAVCAIATTAEAGAQTVNDLVKKGKLTIGVVSGAAPFGSVDGKGTPIGYDVDVANLIGKYMNLPVEIVPLTSPARIPALEAGKVDFLVATLAPTPERAKVVMFTMPYNGFELSIVGPISGKMKNLADLSKKKVGVPRGTTQDTALTRLAVPGTAIVRFEDDATTAQALLSGQVDAVALPNISGKEIIKSRGNGKIEIKFAFSVQPNSMAVRKDQLELHQWLNNFIYYVKLDGELDAIARKWTSFPLPQLPVF